jgi:hypothetical protein
MEVVEEAAEGKEEAADAPQEEAKTEKKRARAKAAPDTTPAATTKGGGLYDKSPVVEGKRERKSVNRLEPTVAVKSPEPTVKEVRRRRRARCACARRRAACTVRPRSARRLPVHPGRPRCHGRAARCRAGGAGASPPAPQARPRDSAAPPRSPRPLPGQGHQAGRHPQR